MKPTTLNVAQVLFVMLLTVLTIDAWSTLALSIKRTGNPNVVAIPAQGPTLASGVYPFFARTPYFVIVDLTNRTSRAVENPFRKEKHAVGVRVAHLLLDENVGTVVAANVGPEVYSNLAVRNVQVFVGDPKSVQDAVAQLEQNVLAKVRSPTVGAHFGLDQKNRAAPGLVPCPGASGAAVPCPQVR